MDYSADMDYSSGRCNPDMDYISGRCNPDMDLCPLEIDYSPDTDYSPDMDYSSGNCNPWIYFLWKQSVPVDTGIDYIPDMDYCWIIIQTWIIVDNRQVPTIIQTKSSASGCCNPDMDLDHCLQNQ